MLVKTILNHCYKFKSFVYKNVHLLSDDKGNPIIVVDIEARTNGQKLCSTCHRPSPGYDRLKPRRYKFVPLWGLPVFLRYARRRVNCPIHGVIVEYIPWAEGKSHLSNVFKLFLSYWAKHLSWSTVAGIYKVQWYHVFESVEWVVEYGLENRCFDKIKARGIIEGFNNKAKVTIKKAYGFKHFRTVEVALYHQLGNLPVPKLTHTFY